MIVLCVGSRWFGDWCSLWARPSYGWTDCQRRRKSRSLRPANLKRLWRCKGTWRKCYIFPYWCKTNYTFLIANFCSDKQKFISGDIWKWHSCGPKQGRAEVWPAGRCSKLCRNWCCLQDLQLQQEHASQVRWLRARAHGMKINCLESVSKTGSTLNFTVIINF